jgi:hypothetical protein
MSLIGARGGALGVAGVVTGLPAGTVLLGRTDSANFTTELTINAGDNISYYKDGYLGIDNGTVSKIRILSSKNYAVSPPLMTVAVWNSSGSLLSHTEITTSDGDDWYSGTLPSPLEIVKDTKYYLGVWEAWIGGAGTTLYTKSDTAIWAVSYPSASYGTRGGNPTPPSISPGTDNQNSMREFIMQAIA